MTTQNMDLEHATNSTIAKASARILMPIMVFVLTIALSIVGYLLVRSWNNFDKALDQFRVSQENMGTQVNTIDKKVSLMSQRVDTMLIRQVESNSDQLKDHEQRLERIERTVPLP